MDSPPASVVHPPASVVHVHHVHEVDEHAVSVMDSAEQSGAATATVALEAGPAPAVTGRPGSDDTDRSGGRGSPLKYDVEEGLSRLLLICKSAKKRKSLCLKW